MKKSAYLIMAHNKFEQLKYLIRLLDSPQNDIFIHIDKKTSNKDFREIVNYYNHNKKNMNSNIIFVRRISVYWGSYSQIEAEIILFEEASKNFKYNYYHLISGECLPLVDVEKINDFFDNNTRKIFITNVSDNLYKNNKVEDRVRYNYYFTSLNNRTVKNKYFRKIIKIYRNIELSINKVFKIDNIKKYNLKLGYASNWVSLDNETIDVIIKNKKWIKKVFKNSIICDELFIPTIINKYNMHNKVYYATGVNDKPEEIQGNLRYINWWDGNPYKWTNSKKDIEYLQYALDKGHLFSRKFDIDTYIEIKKKLKYR